MSDETVTNDQFVSAANVAPSDDDKVLDVAQSIRLKILTIFDNLADPETINVITPILKDLSRTALDKKNLVAISNSLDRVGVEMARRMIEAETRNYTPVDEPIPRNRDMEPDIPIPDNILPGETTQHEQLTVESLRETTGLDLSDPEN